MGELLPIEPMGPGRITLSHKFVRYKVCVKPYSIGTEVKVADTVSRLKGYSLAQWNLTNHARHA